MQIVLNSKEIAQAVINYVQDRYQHNVDPKLRFVVDNADINNPQVSISCDVIDDD